MRIRFCIYSIVLAIAVCSVGASAMADSTHVEDILESPFLKLELDAEVSIPQNDLQLSVYETDYPNTDAQSWLEMFSGNSRYENQYIDVSEHDISFERSNMHAKYFSQEARLSVYYDENKDVTVWWNFAKIGEQAPGISTAPSQAIELAQEWVDQLKTTVGWDGFVMSACYAMPSISPVAFQKQNDPISLEEETNSRTGFYIVEFVRDLAGVAVAFDKWPYLDDTQADLYGDVLQIYLDDEGIFSVKGYYRNYKELRKEYIQISLEDAIEILRENMDYVRFYADDPQCIISEIGLSYRLVQVYPTYRDDACVRTEVRPVWRFASEVNRFRPDVFVMFVDAITGEVLP